MFVKGAPDVLLARSSHLRDADGSSVATEGVLGQVLAENDRLASEGLRVLAVAARDIEPSDFDASGTLLDQVDGLTLLALVGIVDPPRREARDAIARCQEAGIRVRMITGDHATRQPRSLLDWESKVVRSRASSSPHSVTPISGAKSMRSASLPCGTGGQGAPRRCAQAERQRGRHDRGRGQRRPGAQAGGHRRCDGITGTEVTKEVGDMILTDDNFATIVTAVEGGRGIYDNLMKYVRVQLVMLGGFILTFVGAGLFDIAGGAPLTPLQILWINFAVDVVLAIGLGFDAAAPGLMRRRPRDAAAPVVTRALGVRLALASLVMAALALGVVAWGESRYDLVVATTMGLRHSP